MPPEAGRDSGADLERDVPANAYLCTVRLADDAVTVRQLLTHTGGVANPARLLTAAVPDLRAVAGPVISSRGKRGAFSCSNGGYAALGQLIADVSGAPSAEAVAALVLRPLGMRSAWFPERWPGPGSRAVTGYDVTDGALRPASGEVWTFPAAGGLWATAADWSSLLPAGLAHEALRPQVPARLLGQKTIGLGWILIDLSDDLAGQIGWIPGAGGRR